MVSYNFRQTHLLEVRLTQIPVDHAPTTTTTKHIFKKSYFFTIMVINIQNNVEYQDASIR